MALAAGVLLPCLLFVGCGDDRSIRHYRVPREAEAQVAPATGGDESALAWQAPAGWTETPASSMRVASFSVPAEDTPGDCAVFMFSGDGGGLVDNINRWRGQIGLPPETPEQILAGAIEGESGLGPFRAFRIENPSFPDLAFLAAIIPHGDSTVFVKLGVTREHLPAVSEDFLSLVRSLKAS